MKNLNNPRTKKSLSTVLLIAVIVTTIAAVAACVMDVQLVRWIVIGLFLVAVVCLAIVDHKDKPVSHIVLVVICTIIIAFAPGIIQNPPTIGGPGPTVPPVIVTWQLSGPAGQPGTTSTATTRNNSVPVLTQETDANHARAVQKSAAQYYGAKTANSIHSPKGKLSIGETSTFKLAAGTEELCLWFDVKKDGVVDFRFMKNASDKAGVRDVDDWSISVVKANGVVVYEGIINRAEKEPLFECRLPRGDYILVVERTTGNNRYRVIDIDSTYHVL